MHIKKGPGDFQDDYDEVMDSDFGECQECGDEILLSQVEKTQHRVTILSYVKKERHDIDPKKDWWVEIFYGVCWRCWQKFGEER